MFLLPYPAQGCWRNKYTIAPCRQKGYKNQKPRNYGTTPRSKAEQQAKPHNNYHTSQPHEATPPKKPKRGTKTTKTMSSFLSFSQNQHITSVSAIQLQDSGPCWEAWLLPLPNPHPEPGAPNPASKSHLQVDTYLRELSRAAHGEVGQPNQCKWLQGSELTEIIYYPWNFELTNELKVKNLRIDSVANP